MLSNVFYGIWKYAFVLECHQTYDCRDAVATSNFHENPMTPFKYSIYINEVLLTKHS